MGRELIVQLRTRVYEQSNISADPLGQVAKQKVLYEDFVCGRDDATNYIAQLVYNRRESLPDVDEDSLTQDEISDRYSLIFNVNNQQDMNELSHIVNELEEYKEKDYREINKAKEELEDLRAARRNCNNYEEFTKFSDAMESVAEWLESEDFSRAGSLMDFIDECRRKALLDSSHNSILQIVIILSE